MEWINVLLTNVWNRMSILWFRCRQTRVADVWNRMSILWFRCRQTRVADVRNWISNWIFILLLDRRQTPAPVMAPLETPSVPPASVIRPLKVFLIITGQTHGAHQQLLDRLNAQGPRMTPTDDLQLCDVVLLFCPVVSRVGSDVDSAVRKIPDGAQGKPVVLVLMHHTYKPDKILAKTQWSEEHPCINQEVQVLFHQTRNGLLQCPRNQEAVQILQRICDSYRNKNQWDSV